MADYPAEEQGIEKEKTPEEIEQEMDQGEKEADVYSNEGRENLTEDGEMSADEEGFMEGAEGRGQKQCCSECGDLLGEDNVVEREVNGEIKWFCSEEHAQNYAEKHKQE